MRAIVLSNRRLLVNIDERLQVRDIFYKRVGQENHVLGTPHRLGVFVDGELSWLDDPQWRITSSTDCTLCGASTATNERLGVTLTVKDAVLKDHDVLVRRITSDKDVTLFVYHYFFLYGDGIGDCAGYDPSRNALFHYKRNRYFFIAALDGSRSVMSDYTVSVPHDGRDAWRDAEDGRLSKNPIGQGNVDSCLAVPLPKGTVIDYVIVAGKSFADVHTRFDEVAAADTAALIAGTVEEQHWYAEAGGRIASLPARWQDIYKTSVLLVRGHTDAGGAITAANDSENMLFNKDTYSYTWGRDAALVCRALDDAGKHALSREAYAFLRSTLEPAGCYLHKYHPDGSLGSSWHAWVRDGKQHLPLQIDSTALTLYALRGYHEQANDDFVLSAYEPWIAKMIDFLVGFEHPDVPLPKDCWDLWEEREGIHTWSVAAAIAGLEAGALFGRLHDDEARATTAAQVAQRWRDGMVEHLGSQQYGRFGRRLDPQLRLDLTIDAADMAPFLFGVLPADHPLVEGTAKAIEEHLATSGGGIARYQGDYYHRKTEDAAGNAWLICTLWLAQWHLAKSNRERATQLIDWVASRASVANLLPEQVHPVTNEPLGVGPLTWSHAAFIETVLKYAATKRG